MRILIDARGLAACALLPALVAGTAPSTTAGAAPSVTAVTAAVATTATEAPSSASPPPEAVVTWWPERPVQGRLFVLRVTTQPGEASAGREASETPAAASAEPVLTVEGEAAGEPLHFAPAPGGGFESLAPVPVDAEERVRVALTVRYAGGLGQSLEVEVPVAAGEYRHEQLTVAPAFGRAPDEAAQARLARDRAKALEVSRRAHETPRLWTGSPMLPRSDARVTSGFGNGRVFNGQVSSRHMGLDLSGDPGAEVVATARGVVALVDDFLLAGNIVYLNHGGGLVSGYFHLSEQLVAQGDTVEAGTPIGRVGATGRVTGPHLHWVLRYGHTSLDPRSLLEVADADATVADQSTR